jgi:hypothetical protein
MFLSEAIKFAKRPHTLHESKALKHGHCQVKTSSRGLRQGDPLSPYLFLLCAKGLSSLLLHDEEVGGIDGVRVCRNAPLVSHLLFAHDSLILTKADMNNATSLQRVLDTYCANSGQMVSLAKSSIFFFTKY